MKTITATRFRKEMFRILDELLKTGKSREIVKNGKRFLITPIEPFKSKFESFTPKNIIVGDPEELVNIKVWEWDEEKNL
jgi:hypothetical protein